MIKAKERKNKIYKTAKFSKVKLPICHILVSTLQGYPYFIEKGIVVNLNQGIDRAVRDKDRRCLKNNSTNEPTWKLTANEKTNISCGLCMIL